VNAAEQGDDEKLGEAVEPIVEAVVFGRFRLAEPLTQKSPQTLAARFRGAVASLFADDTAFHGHDGDRTVYRYPEVHYRWVDGAPALFRHRRLRTAGHGSPLARRRHPPW